jgi:hypothetical protein
MSETIKRVGSCIMKASMQTGCCKHPPIVSHLVNKAPSFVWNRGRDMI